MNLSNQAEQRLKIQQRADYINTQLLLTTDVAARESFESELAYLRSLYKNTLPDAVIQARTERLQQMRDMLNLRVVDNRRQYQQQTSRAISRLAGLGGAA